MPANYTILPDKGLAYVRFSGHVSMDEVAVCLDGFAKDPNNLVALKHIVDFSAVTSYDDDFVRIIEMQAEMASVFTGDLSQWMFAYYAPNPIGREMANYGLRAWSAVPEVVIRLTDSESHTLDVLGFSERRLGDLLTGVTQS